MRTGNRHALVVACAAALLAGSSARGDNTNGIDPETFRPAIDGYGIFSTERAEVGKQWDVGFRLFVDYARGPLALPLSTGTSTIVSDLTTLHFGAHFSLADWLEVAAVFPVAAVSYGAAFGSDTDPLHPTGFYANMPRSNIGAPTASPLDARLALKLVAPRIGPLGLGLVVEGTLPFGDETAFLGDSGFTVRPRAIVDVTLLRGVTVALNAGYTWRSASTTVLDPSDNKTVVMALGDEVNGSLGAAWRILPWFGIAGEAYALVPVAVPGGAKADTTLDGLGGLNFFPGRSVQVTLGAGAGILSANRRDQVRGFAGISWVPAEPGRVGGLGGGDADNDGIPDSVDKCPSEPEDFDGFQDDDGCPDPDNDGDGIVDSKDACPNEAEDKDGFEDEDGCPDPDNDGDGIPDAVDKCPNSPEDRDGFQDEDGCPDLDNDNDGIPDALDKCPNEPETVNGIDDDDGCPDRPQQAPQKPSPKGGAR